MSEPVSPMLPIEASHGAWYADLLDGARPTVEAALGRLPLADPWSVSRTGLGTAIAVLVARGYGTRRWREAVRVAAGAIETWNHHVHRAAPEGSVRDAWLRGEVAGLRRVWDGLWRRDAALIERVLDRARAPGLGDRPVPESVLFLRGAVAAGVLCGHVPDAQHAPLDRWATWLGLAWEHARGALDPEAWRGAAEAIGSDAPFDPCGESARAAALQALASLDGEPAERLVALTVALPREDADSRRLKAWCPRLAPLPLPVCGHDHADPWSERIEQGMAAIVATDSRVFARAGRFLQAQGGKRVRPRLVLAAAEACGGDPSQALRAAGALEWLHQASLVVDDVIDEAALRRNAPTLHHATSVPFATGTALWLLERLHAASRDLPEPIRGALVDAATALAEGQRVELAHTGDPELSLSGWYRIVEAKTARLFACAAVLGARSAGTDERTVAALARYGREAGLAFQIVDDLLDYVGEQAVLGKRPGTDLRARKITLPWLLLRDKLDGPARAALAEQMREPEPARREASFAEVRDRMLQHGVPEDCLARARTHRARAVDALPSLPGGPDALVALADRLVERRR